MIHSLTLKNFRSIESIQLQFDPQCSCIFGENGSGKTSILEALALLSAQNITKHTIQSLVRNGSQSFFIGASIGDTLLSLSYNLDTRKKIYQVNHTKVSKKKFLEKSIKTSSFSAMTMNMFLLGPSTRRDFIDHILSSSFNNYDITLKKYNTILKNRNALLKSILNGKGQESDLDFWDITFINSAIDVYRYKYIISSYFKKNIQNIHDFSSSKKEKIDFIYNTKLNIHSAKDTLTEYLQKNRQRDIIIGNTQIGPHLDDFTIVINGHGIENYSSRGEIKSIIIGMKRLEAQFIFEKTSVLPVLLIDDLTSELDSKHSDMLLSSIQEYQTILTEITPSQRNKYYSIPL